MPGVARTRNVSVLVAVLCLGCLSLPAHAQIRFDLPPQPLAQALTSVGNLANLNVYFDPTLVDGHSAPALRAQLSVDEALNRLLAGSHLHAVRVDENTVRVISDPGDKRAQNAHAADTGGIYTPPSVRLAYVGAEPPDAQSPRRVAAAEDAQQSSEGKLIRTADVAEVVVSAQKRDERLQDVPVPVTAINAQTLADSNQLRIQDYYTSVPGLSMVINDYGAPQLVIRGLTTGGFTNPTVGIVVDDVPYGSSSALSWGQQAPDIDPSELERIEVLRGPQGTLYGASSLGGLFKYVTVDPSTQAFSGRVEAGTSAIHNGDQPGYNFRAAVNVPLGDTFALRASAFTRLDPGYVDDVRTGQDGINKGEVQGGRLAALWKPSEAVSLKVSALLQHNTTDGSAEVDIGPGLGDLQQTNVRNAGGYAKTFQAYSANFTANLGGGAQITSVTGYNITQQRNSLDYTDALGTYTLGQFGVEGSPIVAHLNTKKFTEEVRLAMPLGSHIDWLVGLFYNHEKSAATESLYGTDPLSGAIVGTWADIPFPSTFTEYAVFTDFTFHFTDQLDVQIGGRESHNRQTYAETYIGPYDPFFLGLPSPVVYPETATKDSSFTYLVTPEYKFTPDLMAYARLASGYRPGGPNQAVAGVPAHFDPDTTNNYEIGLKTDLLDHRLTLDGSLYYINWKDIQLQLVDQATAQYYYANGSRAKSQGVELSAQLRPLDGLSIGAWVSWDDAELTGGLPPASSAVGATGDRLPYSSRFSGNFSIEDHFPIVNGWTGLVSGTASYVGAREGVFASIYAKTPDRQVFPAYAKLDFRAGVQYAAWTGNFYVNNAADRRGLLYGGIGTSIPVAFDYIQPRTVGLSLVYNF